MIDTALVVESFTDYDIISYPALANMTDVTINEGQYYAIMGDGTNTWYSEIFWVQSYTDKFIKLQFWHDEPFVIPGGFHLSYTSPYLSTVYLDTIVNKPKYPYEFDDDDRDGYPLEFEFYTDTAIQATGKVKPATEGFSYDQSSYDDSHF